MARAGLLQFGERRTACCDGESPCGAQTGYWHIPGTFHLCHLQHRNSAVGSVPSRRPVRGHARCQWRFRRANWRARGFRCIESLHARAPRPALYLAWVRWAFADSTSDREPEGRGVVAPGCLDLHSGSDLERQDHVEVHLISTFRNPIYLTRSGYDGTSVQLTNRQPFNYGELGG